MVNVIGRICYMDSRANSCIVYFVSYRFSKVQGEVLMKIEMCFTAYLLHCNECGFEYEANGCDVAIRKCPRCM